MNTIRKITFEDAHRKNHFDFFRSMDQPHFGITADVDITEFSAAVRRCSGLRFTPAMVYLLARAAHDIEAFRYRIRGEEVVEHSMLRPSFAVPTARSSVFSFCTVDYTEDAPAFHREAVRIIEKMQEEPSFEDEPGADNYLFMSSFPWVSFTSVTHAMRTSPVADSVPRIAWGKYYDRDGKTMMPLAVQAHHAVVDGSDLGKYYQRVERLLRGSDEIFSAFF